MQAKKDMFVEYRLKEVLQMKQIAKAALTLLSYLKRYGVEVKLILKLRSKVSMRQQEIIVKTETAYWCNNSSALISTFCYRNFFAVTNNNYNKLVRARQQQGVLTSIRGECTNLIRVLGINPTRLGW